MPTHKNEAKPLILLGFFVLILIFFLSWSVRRDNIAAGSFRLDEIALCEELDDNMNPQERKSRFPGDTKQVCLWFEYARARDGDQLEVQWLFENEDIQRESFRLVHARGTRAFYLLREDGSALPPGEYSVSILCNGRTKGAERFEVEVPSDEETESAEPLSLDLSSRLRKSPDFS